MYYFKTLIDFLTVFINTSSYSFWILQLLGSIIFPYSITALLYLSINLFYWYFFIKLLEVGNRLSTRSPVGYLLYFFCILIKNWPWREKGRKYIQSLNQCRVNLSWLLIKKKLYWKQMKDDLWFIFVLQCLEFFIIFYFPFI